MSIERRFMKESGDGDGAVGVFEAIFLCASLSLLFYFLPSLYLALFYWGSWCSVPVRSRTVYW